MAESAVAAPAGTGGESQPLVPQTPVRPAKRKSFSARRFLMVTVVGLLLYQALVRPMKSFGGYWHYLSISHDKRVPKSESASRFLLILQGSNRAREWLKKYTESAHLSGDNYPLVHWTAGKFKEYGLDVSIEPYYVYLNTPKNAELHLQKRGKRVYSAPLKEDVLPQDPTTHGDTVPIFHGYSASGNVTATYFYANYGRKEDFQRLGDLGVDMSGKIAVVRYGHIYRGLKVKFAQESGASAVLMYSDPGDDGEYTPENGYEQYPKGPARHESSVQRGSVMYLSYGPGDPTTPGYSSNRPDVERQNPYSTTPMIPSIPVSYRDVTPILLKLNGLGPSAKEAGMDWRGKLKGFDYSVGPTKHHELNLVNEQEYSVKPIYNVIGEWKGIIEDEVIIVGNHRDAWVKGGAGDPNSGSATVLEILRALHAMKKRGFKPLRTLVFALFDGEEPGLLGLTEWAEDYAEELLRKVVAYLNLDSAVTGHTLQLQSSPVLNSVLLETAKKVEYPLGGTLYEHFLNGPLKGHVDILGSGSDYTVFLEHLGIPSCDMGFVWNPETDPVYMYHSNYDSFYWMDTFTDPGFAYHNAMSQYLGLVLLHLSEQEVLAFNVQTYAEDIQRYFDDAAAAIPQNWLNKSLPHIGDTDISAALADKLEVPVPKSLSRHFSVSGLLADHLKNVSCLVDFTNSTLAHFVSASTVFEARTQDLQQEYDDSSKLSFFGRLRLVFRLKLANSKLKVLERLFVDDEGLNERAWFKHAIFASGRYTGYAGQSLPGLREAAEDDNYRDGVRWMSVLWKAALKASVLLLVA